MAGDEAPDAPPPEVPEEFADAYRAAYRRALDSDPASESASDPAAADMPPDEGGSGLEALLDAAEFDQEEPSASPREPSGSRYLTPLLVALIAVALIAAAFVVGRLLAAGESEAPAEGSAPTAADREQASDAPDRSTASARPEGDPNTEPGRATGQPWAGDVSALAAASAVASCQASPGVDSAGAPVEYLPEFAADDDPSTAWRCDQDPVGAQVTFGFAEPVRIAEIGLIPGYAKTDPVSGDDRYAENNRITKVRWRFGSGPAIIQRFDPDPSLRDPQLMRIPVVETDRVTLRILAVERGPRNTTAISSALFAAPVD